VGTSLSMMDVPSETIYEDLEGICEESISFKSFNH